MRVTRAHLAVGFSRPPDNRAPLPDIRSTTTILVQTATEQSPFGDGQVFVSSSPTFPPGAGPTATGGYSHPDPGSLYPGADATDQGASRRATSG